MGNGGGVEGVAGAAAVAALEAVARCFYTTPPKGALVFVDYRRKARIIDGEGMKTMADYIVKRVMTHEQVWIVRDEARRGVLNIAQRAREWGIDTRTVRERAKKSDSIYYPAFDTLKEARMMDSLSKYTLGDAD
jgi:hypothetical protein